MRIGIPREILEEEKRVAATPGTVAKYVQLGFEVAVETDAGAGIWKSDAQYADAGAKIYEDPRRLLAESDIILKVKQPKFNAALGAHEADMLGAGSILIAFLHPAAPDNHDMVRKLRDRNITAFTMDDIPRISRAQKMDALTSMSTVTGYKSVILAADRMQRFVPMIATAIGVVQPAQFLVVGAGVVGLQAIATAKRLGGVVKALDIRAEACTAAQSLGAKLVPLEIPQELAVGPGGYARSLDAQWLETERGVIEAALGEADVVILSALVPGEMAPVLITAEMVAKMNNGAMIMDISIDQGGNCQVTQPGRWIDHNGVGICGYQNIPGRLAVDAGWMYANNMYYYVENLFKKGADTMDLDDEITKHSLVTRQSTIHHQGTLKAMRAQEKI